MTKITNYKFSIEEAFKDNFYIVPDYQREFVWTEKEVNRLLEDIDNEMGNTSESEYFIGTVLVSPKEQKHHYDVIDGQQRLTTFFLIICALRVLLDSKEHIDILSQLIRTSYTGKDGRIKSNLKLDPQYENAHDVLETIVKTQSNPEAVKSAITEAEIKQFGSLENLINAYTIVYHFLESNYKENGSLQQYWGYLSNNVVFIQIETDVSSALKIFETINERGVGLNPMDLLKNLLFTNVNPEDFKKLKDEWKNVTKPLEVKNEKPLRFLRYFLMANYKIENNRKDSIVREDEIYDWFTKESNIQQSNYKDEPFKFVRKIIKNVENFLSLTQGKGNDGKENIYMNNIRKLAGGALSLHYVILLSAYNLPKELFDYLLQQLESFLFYYIITKTSTKILEKNFSNWADELRKISEIRDYNQKKDALNEFVVNKFQNNTIAKKQEFLDAMERYSYYSLQQYRTRYILAKLTQYVDMSYKGLSEPSSLDEYTSLQIEHILPNNPADDLKQHFIEQNNNADYNEYKLKLGNLTLLEKPLNIVAGRNFFEKKKEEYVKSKNYLTSSIAKKENVGKDTSINRINEKLKTFDKWNAESINERQLMLKRLAQEVWKVEPLEN